MKQILAITTRETKHGNPGQNFVLSAGAIVSLQQATNLPADAAIKWWAYPPEGLLSKHGWSWGLKEWAEQIGVGLTNDDVLFATVEPHIGYQPRVIFDPDKPLNSGWNLAVIAPENNEEEYDTVFDTPEEALQRGRAYCDESSECLKHGYSRLVIASITTEYFKPEIPK